jgi:hypothetical protein
MASQTKYPSKWLELEFSWFTCEYFVWFQESVYLNIGMRLKTKLSFNELLDYFNDYLTLYKVLVKSFYISILFQDELILLKMHYFDDNYYYYYYYD